MQRERESLIETAKTLAKTAADENRDLTEAESTSLAGMQARGAEIDTQLKSYADQIESQRAYAGLQARLLDADDDDTNPLALGGRAATVDTRSWGDLIRDSGVLESYGGRGTSSRVEVPGIYSRAAADPIMLANIPVGYLPHHVVEPAGPTQSFPLLGVVSREVVSVNAVDYILWAPNPVPPAAIVAEGALKPPTDITATSTSRTLDTYAGWKAITRQTLEDFPRIQSIVENKLNLSLAAAVSAAIAAAINTATAATADGAGNIAAAIRLALAQLQGLGYNPNAVVLNPADAAALDIASIGLMNNPGTWGLTPITSPDITAGSPVVGDFKTAVTVFDRGQTSIFMTDSHADFFLRNQLIILAEQRILVAPVEPSAMVKAVVGVAPVARSAAAK